MSTSDPTTPHDLDTIVIGGGLAGLRAALSLHRAGCKFVLLEASHRIGGRVATDVVDGFLCDRGFQVYLDSYPEGKGLLTGPALGLQSFDPGARIWHGGRWYTVADPFRMSQFLWSTLTAPIGTVLDKIRIALLQFPRLQPGRMTPLAGESTESYLRRIGFSETILDRFFRPFYGGILLDRNLSASALFFRDTFQYFASGRACVPREGMGALAATLHDQLPPESVRLDSQVYSMHSDGAGWTVTLGSPSAYSTIQARSVIVAADRPAANLLLDKSGLPAPPHHQMGDVGTTCFWIYAPCPILKSRFIHLNTCPDEGPIHNLAEMSTISPRYLGPHQGALLAATVLDQQTDKWGNTDTLGQQVLQHLSLWFPASQPQELRIICSQRIPFAQPSQTCLEPEIRVQSLAPGLIVCGDHTTQASINGALRSGRIAAEMILPGSPHS